MSGAALSLPLFFEANRGQTDERVKFLARSSGYTLFVTPEETVFAGARTSSAKGPKLTASAQDLNVPLPEVLRMRLLHSNPEPQITGAKELPGKVNYLIGNNPRNWHTGVPLYEEVYSREVYPGIDLVFHGDQQRLEYDFRVAPGADARRIQFQVSGAKKMEVAENGDLVLHAAKTEFRMRKPLLYQELGDLRVPVDGGFSLQAGKLVAFRVGPYDKTLPLVIDPTIVFSTFLGGGGIELEAGLDLDVTNPSAPRLYVSGTTTDMTSFTETHKLIGNAGAVDYSFIAKIDPTTTGTASLNYLTFIGGSSIFTGGTGSCQNLATGFHLDISPGAGLVQPVILGLTNCSDFPVTVGGPSTGTDDIFITRLTSDGTALDGSTLFGGNGSEGLSYGAGGGLFVGPEGTIVISAQTTSTNLPTTTGAYTVSLNNGTPGGFDDCFVTKLDRSFNILYLTYLNVGVSSTSSNSATCGLGGVDASGKIYMGGNIYSSTAFALANGGTGANGFQKNFVGTAGTTPNVFIAVLDPSQSGLSQLVYSTYVAGGGGTVARAGTVDLARGILYVVGDTLSNSTTNAPDIPLLNAFQTVNNAPAGQGTGFITVMDTTKTGAASLVASTYFGGSTGTGGTSIRGVAFDPVQGNPPTQRLVVAGQTTATNFTTVNPVQATLVGAQNGFVTVFSVPGSGSSFNMAPLFSSYLGGSTTVSNQNDTVRGLVTDSNHAIYALGRTPAANFFGNTTPATTVNGFQPTCASCGGGAPTADLAIFVLTPQDGTSVPDLTVTKAHSGNFTQGQTGAQYTITVKNSGTGSTVGAVTVVDALPSGLTATGITGSGWACTLSPLSCTRSDTLTAGSSYLPITLTVNVSSQAPPSVTNTVVVSGGSETNTNNDSASDVTTITGTVGGCTDNYTGASGGAWGTATSWSKGALPGSADVACIPSGTTVVFSSAAQTISALNSSGTLNLTTGSLTIANNSSANVLNITGGTLVVNGQFTVSGAVSETSGVLGGTGEFDFGSLFTWSGGYLCSTVVSGSCSNASNAVLNASAGISFPASASVVMSNRTLNLVGTATWSGAIGTMTMENGAIINVPSGSVWNFANDSNLSNGGGTGTNAFNNSGTFEKTGGAGTTTVSAVFNNSGAVLGNAATLSFSGGGSCGSTCSGTYTAGTGATLSFSNGIFSQEGLINGTGTVNFNGATMDFGMGTATISATTVKLTTGTLAGAAPGVLNFTTPLNWSSGYICSALSGIACAPGTTNATLNVDAGINFPASASVVLSGRTINVGIGSTVTWAGGAGNLTMENGATINLPAGSVWNYANDSALSNGGGSGINAFNNSGTFEKTGGASTTTVGAVFNNTGTVLGNAATLSFVGGGNCGSSCPGTYTAGTGGTVAFGASTFMQNGPINGTGTVNFNGATMNFGSGTTTISTATINFSSGTFAGVAPGVINITSPMTWTGGYVCSVLVGTSCSLGTNATLNASAINFGSTAAGAANDVLSNRTLNISGAATWGGPNGSLTEKNGATISLASTGTWNFTNDSSLNNGGGTGTNIFNNAGNFEKTGGTGNSQVVAVFNNTGAVNGNSGTLTFDGGGTCGSSCSGTYSAGAGGTINFAQNAFAQSGPITGAGAVGFTGATMDFGTGTTTVSTTAVTFSSGIIGGAAPGMLNFTNNLTWSGGEMCSTLTAGACVAGTAATTYAHGGITFSSVNQLILNNRVLNTAGTTAWTSSPGNGDLLMQNGATINNSGLWDIQNDSYVYLLSGASNTFSNTGTFQKSGGSSTSTTSGIYGNDGTFTNTNTGQVLAKIGQLNMNGASTGSGSWTVSSGAFLNFGSTTSTGIFALSGPVTGAGGVVFSGGTGNVTANYNITGSTTVASGGTANWLSPATVASVGALAISGGTANFSSGNPVTANTLTLSNGNLAGTDAITISGATIWTGGNMCTTVTSGSCAAPAGAQGSTTTSGGITFSSVNQLQLNGRVLSTAGTTAWTSSPAMATC